MTATPSLIVIAPAAIREESGFLRICGEVKSGKTEVLLRRVCALMEQEVDPGDICVVVNTAHAADAFGRRLAEMLAKGGQGRAQPRITTMWLLAVGILGCEEARLALARQPRVLNAYERGFVLRDLAASGFAPSCIKRALTSLGRFWSAGATVDQPTPGPLTSDPPAPDPSVDGDTGDDRIEVPTGLRTYLERYLTLHQAMLPEELSYLCIRFIKHGLWQTASLGFDHIMVDDFQNLSRASQMVCEALARKSLAITGNPEAPVMNRDAFPYPEGFAGFAERHDPVITVTLGRAGCGKAGERPTDSSDAGVMLEQSAQQAQPTRQTQPAQQILNIKWRTPEDEAKGVSRWIRKLTSGDEGASLSDFYLIVSNSHWARAFEQALTDQYREHVTLLSGQLLAGDPSEPTHYPALIDYTRLNLLAEPDDPIAWRCWCGLGAADLGAESWTSLLALAQSKNLTVLEALALIGEAVDGDEAAGSDLEELRRRYREGKALIERNRRKSGYALLKAVAGDEPDRTFSLLIEPFEGVEDARVAFGHAWKCALDPRFGDGLDAVRIVSYGELTGLSPQTVVLVGLNDGLMPPANPMAPVSPMPPIGRFAGSIAEPEGEPIGQDYEALFRDALGKADKTLVLSAVQKTERELAESLGIRTTRLKTEHGKTMAMLSPSRFLQNTGGSIPGSESGEYFLNQL